MVRSGKLALVGGSKDVAFRTKFDGQGMVVEGFNCCLGYWRFQGAMRICPALK